MKPPKKETIAKLALVSSDDDGTVIVSTAGTKAAPSASLSSYRLEWGDGQEATGAGAPAATFTHVYGAVGDKHLRLTVRDSKSGTGTQELAVSVHAATPPTLVSMLRQGASPTNASSVTWLVTFSEPVFGLTLAAFNLLSDGLTGPALTSLSGVAGSLTYVVTASRGTGDGTLGLMLSTATGIVDSEGTTITGLPVLGQIYTFATVVVPPVDPPPDPGPDGPDDITAASCSLAHVQAAVDLASDGQIVGIPAGACTWASHLGLVDKNIYIRGAGDDQTIITRSGGDNGFFVYAAITNASKGAFRLSHMRVNASAVTGSIVYVTSGSLAAIPTGRWRVDHIYFDSPLGQRSGIHTSGVNYGVVDHVTFNWGAGIVIRQANSMNSECGGAVGGSMLSGDFQNTQPLDLGTNNFLFVEDTTILSQDNGSLVGFYDASSGGGRIVYRHNTGTGGFFYNHWTRGCEMAAQVMEIYNNTFTGDNTYGAPIGAGYMIRLEAGTGVIYNNNAQNFRIGVNPPYVILDDRRADHSENTGPLNDCDGSETWDGNVGDPAAPGWPCLGQIGRAPGKTLAQISGGDKPVSAPLYLWNNGEQAGCTTGGACTDTWGVFAFPSAYIKDTPHPNGDIDYSNSNTPKPGYTAYTYPHPLVTAGWP